MTSQTKKLLFLKVLRLIQASNLLLNVFFVILNAYFGGGGGGEFHILIFGLIKHILLFMVSCFNL